MTPETDTDTGSTARAKRNKRIGLALLLVCLVVAAAFLFGRKTPPPPPPPPVSSRPVFSFSESEFITRFNAAAAQTFPGMYLVGVGQKAGEVAVNSMYTVSGSPATVLTVATVKGDATPYNIFVSGEHPEAAIRVFLVLTRVLSPELTEDQRLDIQVDLQLSGGLPGNATETTRGKVKYSASSVPGGIIVLGASPL